MVKKSFILLFLFALATSFTAKGQTVTVGNGTSTQYQAPINNWYTYSFTEMIYTAEELAIVQHSRSTIIKLGLPSVSGQNGYTCNVTIYMKNVSVDQFTSTTFIPVSDDDVVYSGPVTSSVPGWLTIVLDEAFNYNGESNLLVAINKTTGSYPGQSYKWYYTPTTNKYTLLHRYRDNLPFNPTLSLTNGSQSTYRPDMQFTFGAPITCHKPTLSPTVEASPTTATVTWIPQTDDQQLFDLYWSTDNIAPTEETLPLVANISGTSYTIGNLIPSTHYYVWLRGNCGTEENPDISGGWTEAISFDTQCVPVTEFPWIEDFENHPANPQSGYSSTYAFSELCWTNEVVSGSSTKLFEVSTYNSHTNFGNNTKQLRLPDQISGNRIKLCLPEMNLPGNNYQFVIDVYRNATGSSYTSEGVRVFASPDGTIENATELGFLYRNYTQSDGGIVGAEASSGWYTYMFPIPFSGTCYIILRGESQYGSSTYLDNFSVEPTSCPIPTQLAIIINSEGTTATATWTGISDSYNIEVNGVVTEGVTPPYTIENLELATTYTVRVQANCGYGLTSDWNNPVSITTSLCLPENQCELTFVLTDSFGDGWSGNAIQVTDVTTGVVVGTIANENLDGATADPEVNTKTLSVCDGRELQFSWIYGSWTSECSYEVYDINGEIIFSGNGAISDPVNYIVNCIVCPRPEGLGVIPSATFAKLNWTGEQDQYLVCWGASYDNLCTPQLVEGTTLTIESLQPGQDYVVRIKGLCSDDQTTSAAECAFTTGIYWDDPEAWDGNQIPGNNQPVTIPENTNVIIPSGDVIQVAEITFEPGASITIEGDGQLAHTTEIPVTLIKNLADPSRDNSGYRLLASPADDLPVTNSGLLNNYNSMDLYSFDQYYSGFEWRNYKTSDNFNTLELKKGYLYYNSQTVVMTIFGNTVPTNQSVSEPLSYNSDVPCSGWNLLGNPYTCNTKIYSDPECTNEMGHYVLNNDGSEIMIDPVTADIIPAEGFFVLANETNQTCYFSATVGGNNTTPAPEALEMTVRAERGTRIDAARVRFDNASPLQKVQFNPAHTKVYIKQDGKNFAIAKTENAVGELPISFEAEHNGTYTLDFSIVNVDFSYLHLIDDLTGADVNLLDYDTQDAGQAIRQAQAPSYTFESKVTDYSSRFRLVYAIGTSEDPSTGSDTFAFINSDGNLTLFDIEGDSSTELGTQTLQVIDVTGHILISETFSDSYSKHLGVPAGLYLLRLINGDVVKVQKIVLQ